MAKRANMAAKKRAYHDIHHMIRMARHHTIPNEYIHTGYRDTMSAAECVNSAFELHNETLNIWSHVIGILQILWMFYRDFVRSDSQIFPWNSMDIWAPLFHLFGWFSAFACSICFHTLRAHLNPRLVRRFLILDYVGVYVAVISHPVYFIYVTMHGWSYLHLIWVGVVALISKSFFMHIRKNRHGTLDVFRYLAITQLSSILVNLLTIFYRSYVIYASKLSAPDIFSVLYSQATSHGTLFSIIYDQIQMRPLYWTGLLALGLGGLCFKYHIPEVFFPGKFDHVGHSHILHHLLCMVVAHCSYTDGAMYQRSYLMSSSSVISRYLAPVSAVFSISWSLISTATRIIIKGA